MLEAVGAAIADVGALVGVGVEGAGMGTPHGVTDKEAEAINEVVGDLFRDESEDRVYEFRLVLWGAALPLRFPSPRRGQGGWMEDNALKASCLPGWHAWRDYERTPGATNACRTLL